MNQINYQKELDRLLGGLEAYCEKKPRLLLHSCCAPCSSYCLVYLREYFDISCFYYNPNITDKCEYDKRVAELIRLADRLNNDPIRIIRGEKGDYRIASQIDESLICEENGIYQSSDYLDRVGRIEVIEGNYEPQLFIDMAEGLGLTKAPEGGARCVECFALRLAASAKKACEINADYLTTSLTISPLKNAYYLNEIGMKKVKELADNTSLKWLPSDFKKKNGYKFSIELSARYGLYRQNFCGCEYSKV